MNKVGETTLEIDLRALAHNYHYLRSKLDPDAKFMAVVKAFAYGSDAVAVSQKLEDLGADYLAVAYVKEGVALREAGVRLPILVLHPQPLNFTTLIDYELEPSLYSPRILRLFLECAKNRKVSGYPVHIKFNTGLNRLGFWENDVDYIMEQLQGRDEISIKALFSHLAASEDPKETEFSKRQIKTFITICQAMDSALGQVPLRHLLNTSGIVNYPEAQFDMVRSGIGLYGYGNHAAEDEALRPVAALKTIISQLHQIEPGETVGYNRAFTATGYQKIATLPVGHADGIARTYGNGNGFVWINNQKAPIIGNVCMDMIMIDVTGIDCRSGDEVIVFGSGHSAEKIANAADTISYELLTAVSQRVSRKILE
ncbi:MAG: alanine racemase [Flavobacteriaceae bacterium]|nr:alanine racemase [Flavobacteriaceae bacterium]